MERGDYDSSWYDWDGYDSEQSPYVPSGPDRPDEWSECLDRRVDDLAELAANLINQLPDSDRVEYGYLIWQDGSGQLHLSSRISGDNHSLTGLNPASVPSDFGFTSWDQVVGIVHSHPTLRERPDGSWVNIDSSDNHHLPNTGDWEWPDFFVEQGSEGDTFRQYILHDGALYEYDSYENQQGDRQTGATNADGECP